MSTSPEEIIDHLLDHLAWRKEDGQRHVVFARPLQPAAKTTISPALTETRKSGVLLQRIQRLPACGDASPSEVLIFGEPKLFARPGREVLDKILKAAGFERCGEPTDYVHRQAFDPTPAALLSLGSKALDELSDGPKSIGASRGTWHKVGDYDLLPTLDPAILGSDKQAKTLVWSDFQSLLSHLGLELPPWSQRFAKG
jgi:hypothetical protein